MKPKRKKKDREQRGDAMTTTPQEQEAESAGEKLALTVRSLYVTQEIAKTLAKRIDAAIREAALVAALAEHKMGIRCWRLPYASQ